MSEYRKDLEVHDIIPAAVPPSALASWFIPPTSSIRITTLEYGAELTPIVRFEGRGHGALNLHFDGGPRAVERLRDRLTEYLELVERDAAVAAVQRREDREAEAEASEEGKADRGFRAELVDGRHLVLDSIGDIAADGFTSAEDAEARAIELNGGVR